MGRMAVGVGVWIGVDGRGLRAVRRALRKKERGREDVQVGRTGRGCEALVGRDCTSVSRGVNAMLSMLTSSFAGVHGRVRGRVHYAMVVLGRILWWRTIPIMDRQTDSSSNTYPV